MAEETTQSGSSAGWNPGQVMVLCTVCLAIGLLMGYLVRGSSGSTVAAGGQLPSQASTPAVGDPAGQAQTQPQMPKEMPSLDDMKRMADKKAEPLLAKLKTDSKNAQLLNEIGRVYKSAHQFKEAGSYFEQALVYDPKNIGVRADYASCLYFTGDVDGALGQLDKSLTYDPQHAGTLLNIGIIRWKGKNDVSGAVASWEKLLQYHPDFPQKDMVQQMITQAKESLKLAGAGQKG